MLFKTHIVFSVTLYFLLDYILIIPNRLLFFLFMIIATIFVDIDSYKSKIGNRWYLRPIQWITKHRGMIHSIIFAIFLSVVIASINQWAGVGFFAGYLSHITLDALTRHGVALFWPFTRWKIRFGIKSGGVLEQIIFVLLLLGDIFIVGRFLFIILF